jgi:hypothetical protein
MEGSTQCLNSLSRDSEIGRRKLRVVQGQAENENSSGHISTAFGELGSTIIKKMNFNMGRKVLRVTKGINCLHKCLQFLLLEHKITWKYIATTPRR